MNYQPDKYQQKALKTWHSEGILHPLIKLVGECGELVDLYGKEEYKPNFSWFFCDNCKQDIDHHINDECPVGDKHYISLIHSELGDILYYIRILAHEEKLTLADLEQTEQFYKAGGDMLFHIVNMDNYAIGCLDNYLNNNREFDSWWLKIVYYHYLCILELLETNIEEIMAFNYVKLNSEETHHGWNDAASNK